MFIVIIVNSNRMEEVSNVSIEPVNDSKYPQCGHGESNERTKDMEKIIIAL